LGIVSRNAPEPWAEVIDQLVAQIILKGALEMMK
jgi:hypothetical protein